MERGKTLQFLVGLTIDHLNIIEYIVDDKSNSSLGEHIPTISNKVKEDEHSVFLR